MRLLAYVLQLTFGPQYHCTSPYYTTHFLPKSTGQHARARRLAHAVRSRHHKRCALSTDHVSKRETTTVEHTNALQFSYNSVAQEIVCDTDAISGLCHTLHRLGAKTAMVVCGPSILRSSDVIRRVQEALRERYVGL